MICSSKRCHRVLVSPWYRYRASEANKRVNEEIEKGKKEPPPSPPPAPTPNPQLSFKPGKESKRFCCCSSPPAGSATKFLFLSGILLVTGISILDVSIPWPSVNKSLKSTLGPIKYPSDPTQFEFRAPQQHRLARLYNGGGERELAAPF
ncbi:hypothetical protein Mapa_001758 [Marchantia paleacea]|nr:hypothetical protein Mapa_001758 [Marchantia paleacea]